MIFVGFLLVTGGKSYYPAGLVPALLAAGGGPVLDWVLRGRRWRPVLAVVLTADEDDRNSGNRVLTVVIHPSQHAHVVSTSLTHYSLTRLYSQVIGSTTYLRNAASAPNMAAAFGLPLS